MNLIKNGLISGSSLYAHGCDLLKFMPLACLCETLHRHQMQIALLSPPPRKVYFFRGTLNLTPTLSWPASVSSSAVERWSTSGRSLFLF